MSTKFFTNTSGNTLFEKFRALAEQNPETFRFFDAVTGYFRASGYFKLRKVLGCVTRIRVLIGMEYDALFRKHEVGRFFVVSRKEAAELFREQFIKDVKEANYTPEVEKGILQLLEDVKEGRVELRAHPTKSLHAKFYLCLPEQYGENALTGLVIMGSSNLTDAGLGADTRAPRYELNVEMRDYDDVAFCKAEFEKLWEESEELTLGYDVLEEAKQKTYLGVEPTPYELYMKLLMESFQDFVEDTYDFNLPLGVLDLQYQRDAALQGYRMLRRTHGFYLADVVGLGKTLVAMLVIQRFIFENGAHSHVLVVTPPAAKAQWERTAEEFKIKKRQITIVTNGSLSKVENDCENIDLVVVDEAHGFRSKETVKFEALQKICKTHRAVPGRIPDARKFVMLLSATPLNNRPGDLHAQIALFQDEHACTLDNISDLSAFFSPLEQNYKHIIETKGDLTEADRRDIERIYSKIRTELLSQIMVRRTRTNIEGDARYLADLTAKGICFPRVEDPQREAYLLDDDYARLFAETVRKIRDELFYARYRAVEFLKKPVGADIQRVRALSTIFKIHMVKRVESSISAFKESLENLTRYTEQMLDMFKTGKVIIAPEFDVKKIIEEKEGDIDAAVAYLEEHCADFKKEDHLYHPDDFQPQFLDHLKKDHQHLLEMKAAWNAATERYPDPKLEHFLSALSPTRWLNPKYSNEGKLIVFSESATTACHLCKEVRRRNPALGKRCLCVESSTFPRLREDIQANFDANLPADQQRDDYSILFTTDVLAEGINLHRANTLVHYDTPWNATRLMQRIGRVNRIGSTSAVVHNIVFYPSEQGNNELNLCRNTFAKLTGFHTALGEDARIFTEAEVLHEFKMFQANPKRDDEDERLELLREVQAFYEKDRAHYQRIKEFPEKVRTFRDAIHISGNRRTLVFLKSGNRLDYYAVTQENRLHELTFVQAAKAFKATTEEPRRYPDDATRAQHATDVRLARGEQQAQLQASAAAISSTGHILPKNLNAKTTKDNGIAQKLLRAWGQKMTAVSNDTACYHMKQLLLLVQAGTISALEKTLVKYSKHPNFLPTPDAIAQAAADLYQQYQGALPHGSASVTPGVPANIASIVLSETFVDA